MRAVALAWQLHPPSSLYIIVIIIILTSIIIILTSIVIIILRILERERERVAPVVAIWKNPH